MRFVATNLCSIVTEGKKFDVFSSICARLFQKGRSTISCHQFVLDCHRRGEIRFVATNLCSIVTEGKKYDLLPPICARLSQKGNRSCFCHQFGLDYLRREEIRFSVTNWSSIDIEGICCHQFVLDSQQGKKYDLLPIYIRLFQKGRIQICCLQFVFDCHRREEIRSVVSNLCSIVIEGKKNKLI